ncbi:MAG: gamma-glutamyl-gamma-aminobutyrate hydrolase family protein [Planctomycetota bacterium]
MSGRPRIAVTLSHEDPRPDRELFRGKHLQYLEQEMLRAVAAAGGLPLLLPDLADEELHRALLEGCDGLLLTGGADLDPRSYGEEPLRDEWRGDGARDLYELSLVHEARRRGLPVLGVCRGFQLLAVALGGSLWQDLESQREGSLRHRDQERYDRLAHEVVVEPGGLLADLVGPGPRTVNSVHHQGLRAEPGGVRVEARAEDGLVEAFSLVEGWGLGIQWHPEWMEPASQGRVDPVFVAFVAACRG